MSDMKKSDCGVFDNCRVNGIYRHLAEANAPLAMGYVPYQCWGTTYDLCRSLATGTIFPALDQPFCGRGGRRQ